MSVLVRLESNGESLDKAEKRLHGVKVGVEKAVMRAINRSLTSGRTELSRGIRETYTVKAADIKSTIRLKKATTSSLEGSIESEGQTLSLRHFKHSPSGVSTTGANRKQIRVTEMKGRTTKFKTGFLWVGGWDTDKHSIYIRAGKKIRPRKGYHKGKKYEVEKIKKVFGPSVPQMAGNDGVRERVQTRVQEDFEKRLEHETLRLLEK